MLKNTRSRCNAALLPDTTFFVPLAGGEGFSFPSGAPSLTPNGQIAQELDPAARAGEAGAGSGRRRRLQVQAGGRQSGARGPRLRRARRDPGGDLLLRP